MIEMFKYLTGILSKKEQKFWKILAVMDFISPLTDIINFSVIIYIMNVVIQEQQASREIVGFTYFMGMVSVLKGLFDLYKCKIRNQFIYDGAEELSEKLFELLLKEDLMHHNQKNVAQAFAFVRDDSKNSMNIIVASIDIWINSITLTGYFAVMIYTSKWLGLVSCAAFVALVAGLFFFYRNQIQLYGERSRAYAIKANAQITIAYGNFKETKIADNASAILQRYCDAGEEFTRVQKQFQYKKSVISMFMQNFVMTAMFLILAFFLGNPGENTNYFLASMVVYLKIGRAHV